eukprot:TRINITY_DN2474_c0_g4_i1.p1 TRINITY_DN2474_c0_g4~~TRINITY_DN2474_c0_g4_i1.p1  ORF type:complete len:180 (+),score=41.31 TRINITY_DN2474_c0_g4_i1:75-614(+)
MPTGTLKKYFSEKGFGFIEPEAGGEDLFAHSKDFQGDQDSLRGGESVSYDAEWDDRKGKNKAANWSVVGGGGGGGGGYGRAGKGGGGGGGGGSKMGTVKKFLADKGFGFITPDDGGDDLFAHSRQYDGDQYNINEGDRVSYESEWDSRANKSKARSWAPAGGGGYGGPPQHGGHRYSPY